MDEISNLIANNVQDGLPVVPGVLVGLVESLEDPKGLGRVKVSVPILGDGIVLDWAPVASFWAGKDQGAYFRPAVKDQVLVAFQCGHTSMPYVIGSIWSEADKPIVAKKEQSNYREIKTSAGAYIRLDETKGNEKIEITDHKKNKVLIDTKENSITIEAKKDIMITAGGDLTVKAKTITLDGTDIKEKAKSSISMDGKTIAAKAPKVDLG